MQGSCGLAEAGETARRLAADGLDDMLTESQLTTPAEQRRWGAALSAATGRRLVRLALLRRCRFALRHCPAVSGAVGSSLWLSGRASSRKRAASKAGRGGGSGRALE